jgi:hypothetical protein
MDKQVEEMVNGCMICQSSDKSAKTFTAPMQPVARPSGHGRKLVLTLLGQWTISLLIADMHSLWWITSAGGLK